MLGCRLVVWVARGGDAVAGWLLAVTGSRSGTGTISRWHAFENSHKSRKSAAPLIWVG